MTDSKGRTVDFTNTVIILTSNVGAEHLLSVTEKGENKAAVDQLVMNDVQERFPPEFLNRLSAIVLFNSLGLNELEKVVQKSMTGVRKRLAAQNMSVVLESSGSKAILTNSYDPNYGARPVERYLESTVVTKLSRMLISGELVSGSTVYISGVESDEDSYDDTNIPLQKKARLNYRVEHNQDIMDDDNGGEKEHGWESMEEE